MMNQNMLYKAYFSARDRFSEAFAPTGYEPDIIHNFIQTGLNLASSYERDSDGENVLLCELFLRQIYFRLLDSVEDPYLSITFRQMCLDNIYIPLLL